MGLKLAQYFGPPIQAYFILENKGNLRVRDAVRCLRSGGLAISSAYYFVGEGRVPGVGVTAHTDLEHSLLQPVDGEAMRPLNHWVGCQNSHVFLEE